MGELEFRPMRIEDYALAEQFKRATTRDAMGDDGLFDTWFPEPGDYAAFLTRQQAIDPWRCVLAWREGSAIGEVHVRMMGDGRGYLNNIYLLPAWRGKGLGAQLDGYAMEYFRQQGATRAALRTNPGNPKLVDFYTRMGWELGALCDGGMVWMERAVG